MRAVVLLSLMGGVCGALLLVTPQSTFDRVIPGVCSPARLRSHSGLASAVLRAYLHIGTRTLLVLQFLLAIYGGYFGGAVGLLMLAVWTVFGISDVRAMNAGRILAVTVMNSVAVVTFAIAGKVFWVPALTMGASSMLGGYAGARVGSRIRSARLRFVISCFNVGITAIFSGAPSGAEFAKHSTTQPQSRPARRRWRIPLFPQPSHAQRICLRETSRSIPKTASKANIPSRAGRYAVATLHQPRPCSGGAARYSSRLAANSAVGTFCRRATSSSAASKGNRAGSARSGNSVPPEADQSSALRRPIRWRPWRVVTTAPRGATLESVKETP